MDRRRTQSKEVFNAADRKEPYQCPHLAILRQAYLKPLLLRLKIKTIEDGRDKYRVAPRVGLHAFRRGNTSVMDTDALLRARRDNHLSRRLPEVAAPLRVRQDRVGHVDADLKRGTYTHARSADHQAVAAKLGELTAPPRTS